MSEIKVLEGYRITLPEDVRRKLRINKGDALKWELRGRELILRAEHIPLSPTMQMVGLAAGVKSTPEQAVIEEVDEKVARQQAVRRR